MKFVTVNVAVVFPEPLSLVKTLPVIGLSSKPVAVSSTTIGVLSINNLATELVTLPQTKLDCAIFNRYL